MHCPALAPTQVTDVTEAVPTMFPEVAEAETPAVEFLCTPVRGLGLRVSSPSAIARGDIIAVAGSSLGAYDLSCYVATGHCYQRIL